ncbi:MAG TPA: type IV pilus biogenesis/stability protein PilW [Usitatibacter sp.]|nr:type IV pilus biogenesis/stability protein PilW [Usitatibacter sp.]
MRAALAIAAVLLAACSSQSSVQSKPVTENEISSARHRAEVHTALAGEYYARGAYAVALSETRLAIQDDDKYFAAWNMQGLVFMELREDGPAREAFERALALSPNNAEVLNNYGWFLCTRNDGNRGLDLMQRAYSDPLYPTPEKAYLSAGLCLRRLGRTQEAEEKLRRAVLIRPDMIGALYNLAALTYDRGAYKDAENYLTRYMRLTTLPPLDALVLGTRIARANGDSGAEQSYLQQLRRRFPDSPELAELEKKS